MRRRLLLLGSVLNVLLFAPRAGMAADAAARDQALQAARDRFPAAAARFDRDDRALPVVLIMNKNPVSLDGVRYDGFRFTAPADGPGALVWGFLKQANLAGWYIVPATGTMHGFTRFFHHPDAQNRTMIVQTLPASALEAGREYIIWFSFKDAIPTPITFWLRFARPGSMPSGFAAVRALLNPAPVD